MASGKLYRYFFVLLSFSLLISCNDSEPTKNDQSDFQNIAKTDETGMLIEDDLDDWQPRVNSIGSTIDSVIIDIVDNQPVYEMVTLPILTDSLMANPAYPNPFNQEITLQLAIAIDCHLTIEILDYKDHVIKTLDFPSALRPGMHMVMWSGLDDSNQEIPNGVYRAIITAVSGSKTWSVYGDIEKSSGN